MAFVQIVTGYVPIFGHPRSPKEYGELAEKTFAPLARAGVPIVRFMQRMEETWLWKYCGNRKNITHSQGDNPNKNTLEYHCVNHQKFGWLRQAARRYPQTKVWVWIDFGVGHVPGVTPSIIYDFIAKIEKDRAVRWAVPGCWPLVGVQDDASPCWRFCGGVMVVPATRVQPFYRAVKKTALAHIDRTRNVTWEVNTMAEAEAEGRLPKLEWYQADHNETMFTGYHELAPRHPILPS